MANDKRYILDHLKELLEEEISEAGVRLAKAKLAEEEGLDEAASALRQMAIDEARHATLIARLLPEERFKDTKSNVMSAINRRFKCSTKREGFRLRQEARGWKRRRSSSSNYR